MGFFTLQNGIALAIAAFAVAGFVISIIALTQDKGDNTPDPPKPSVSPSTSPNISPSETPKPDEKTAFTLCLPPEDNIDSGDEVVPSYIGTEYKWRKTSLTSNFAEGSFTTTGQVLLFNNTLSVQVGSPVSGFNQVNGFLLTRIPLTGEAPKHVAWSEGIGEYPPWSTTSTIMVVMKKSEHSFIVVGLTSGQVDAVLISVDESTLDVTYVTFARVGGAVVFSFSDGVPMGDNKYAVVYERQVNTYMISFTVTDSKITAIKEGIISSVKSSKPVSLVHISNDIVCLSHVISGSSGELLLVNPVTDPTVKLHEWFVSGSFKMLKMAKVKDSIYSLVEVKDDRSAVVQQFTITESKISSKGVSRTFRTPVAIGTNIITLPGLDRNAILFRDNTRVSMYVSKKDSAICNLSPFSNLLNSRDEILAFTTSFGPSEPWKALVSLTSSIFHVNIFVVDLSAPTPCGRVIVDKLTDPLCQQPLYNFLTVPNTEGTLEPAIYTSSFNVRITLDPDTTLNFSAPFLDLPVTNDLSE